MRQYRTILEQKDQVEKIICNRCGKEIPVRGGVPGEDVLEVEKRWGYLSGKDNQVDRFDICEACYDEIVAGFKIQPKENQKK